MTELVVTSEMLAKARDALGAKAESLSDQDIFAAYSAMTKSRLGSQIVPVIRAGY